jgi:hypothetical protein
MHCCPQLHIGQHAHPSCVSWDRLSGMDPLKTLLPASTYIRPDSADNPSGIVPIRLFAYMSKRLQMHKQKRERAKRGTAVAVEHIAQVVQRQNTSARGRQPDQSLQYQSGALGESQYMFTRSKATPHTAAACATVVAHAVPTSRHATR